MADCPEAERDEEMGRDICYRCGSTEHEIQRCRAKIDPALGKEHIPDSYQRFDLTLWIVKVNVDWSPRGVDVCLFFSLSLVLRRIPVCQVFHLR